LGAIRKKHFNLKNKMKNNILNTIKKNPEGAIIGFGVGYILATNVLLTNSIIVIFSASIIGLLVGAVVQNKITNK